MLGQGMSDFPLFSSPETAPQPAATPAKTLFGATEAELTELVRSLGEPAFRARQITEALYRQWVDELDGIRTLPAALRQKLTESGFPVGRPRIQQVFCSVDGTERYLVQTSTGETVETVWMPDGDESEAGDEDAAERLKATICVSSQVGCAVNCQFCLTARLGLQRNLTAGEIAGQVVATLQRHGAQVGRDRVNLVFMGMGEPFLNYENFSAAVRLLVQEVGLSPRRMTVSTSGVVPGMERFAAEPEAVRPKLAISLNASDDETRTRIMPINRKWAIADVLAAAGQVPLRSWEKITFEYVLLGGVTDREEDAARLIRLLRRAPFPLKVNLIAWNPGPDAAWVRPSAESVDGFRQRLVDAGIAAYLRKPRGQDIYAACGQLKRTVEG